MNRIIKSAVLFVAAITTFGGCVKNNLEPVYDDPVSIYKAAFKAYVGGGIHPNQVWGFGKSQAVRTRAAETATVSVSDDYNTVYSTAYKQTIQEYFPEGEACKDSKYLSYEFDENAPYCFIELIYCNTTSSDVVGVYYYDPKTEKPENAVKLPIISDLQSNINHYINYSQYASGALWRNDINPSDGYSLWADSGKRAKRIKTRTLTLRMNPNYRFGFYVTNKSGKTYYSNKYLNEGETECGGLIGYENVGAVIDNYVFGLSDDGRPGCEILLTIPKMGDGGKYPTPVAPEKTEPEPQPDPKLEWHRIIAEDLTVSKNSSGINNESDFDFNDIVLDVALTKTGASCILQAAGATLKIRINGNNALEVHKLFGVLDNVMVNTDAEKHGMNGMKKDPVEFTIEGSFSSIDKIKIEVFRNNGWIELTAPPGDAASKIAVGTDFEWTYERQSLKSKYPDFPKYATDNVNVEEWWKHMND